MIIFIDSNMEFERAAPIIYKSLGINQYLEGDSLNVLGGHYNSFDVLGMTIKLELNSYDYEDGYKYMLQIQKDFVNPLKGAKEIEDLFCNMILKLLESNLDMAIAVEKDNDLLKIK